MKKDQIHILYIEDHPQVNKNFALLFAELEIDAKGVLSAEEGLKYLETDGHRISLILLDYRLIGGMDGLDFAKKMRADQRFDHIPFVVMSAYATGEGYDEFKALGASDYVEKMQLDMDSIPELLEAHLPEHLRG